MDGQRAARAAAIFKDSYPVWWADRQAVVVLPEHIGHANAGQVSEELLSVINRGADALIVDGLWEERPGHGTALAQATMPRPAGAGARLAGARKDGARFPVELRSTPVHTPAAQFTLTVIRDVTGNRPEGHVGLAYRREVRSTLPPGQ